MNYYKFIDKICKFNVSEHLLFVNGEVSLNKKSFIILFEVKAGCEDKIKNQLDQNIHIKNDIRERGRKITKKKYSYVYNEGNIKQRYMLTITDKSKSLIEVHLYLIEKDGKLYFFVYTW